MGSLSKNQMDELMNYMVEHSLLATNEIYKLGTFGKDKANELWNEIVPKLNKLGKLKTLKQWKSVFIIILN